MSIPIIYQDECLLAADKPAGISSIRERDGTASLHEKLETLTGEKLFIVHRLDKAVSGTILFAKNADAHRRINRIFLDRTLTKRYIAVVHGVPSPETGVIASPLKQFGSGRTGVHPDGKPSRTEYAVTEIFGGYSLVSIRLVTGRRHQIRAHFYSIGNPVAGDLRYGDRNIQKNHPRLLLHSSEIILPDWNGREVKIFSPLPADFTSAIESLKCFRRDSATDI